MGERRRILRVEAGQKKVDSRFGEWSLVNELHK